MWLSSEWQKRADEIGKALPGTLNVPISSSRDGNVVVLESTSPTTVPAYYLYNAAAKKLMRIGVTHPEIPPDDDCGTAADTLHGARWHDDSWISDSTARG